MPRPGVAWGGFLLGCAAPGLLPVLPALRRPSPPARRPWRRSLITVTHDGSDGGGRDQRAGTSPILGRRSFPLVSTLNRGAGGEPDGLPAVLADRNRAGRPSAPLRLPATEATRFRYAAFRSAGACWTTTADTAPGRARSGVALAAVSRADRRAPLGPAPAHRTPRPPRLTGSRRPRRRPERPACWHLFRSRCASVPVSRARISPTVSSRPSGSGSGRWAWMW